MVDDGWFEAFMDWSERWVMQPLMVSDKVVEIRPAYWSCTSAYIRHIPARQGMLTRFGRTSGSQAHDVCICKQWTSHMVNEPPPPDVGCPNGWAVSELRGVR